ARCDSKALRVDGRCGNAPAGLLATATATALAALLDVLVLAFLLRRPRSWHSSNLLVEPNGEQVRADDCNSSLPELEVRPLFGRELLVGEWRAERDHASNDVALQVEAWSCRCALVGRAE